MKSSLEPHSSAEYVKRTPPVTGYRTAPQHKDRYWLHVTLFLLTLVSTMVAGGQLTGRFLLYTELDPNRFFSIFTDPMFLLDGFRFGGALLLFLTVHEFGHYFAARSHGISTSLPYYIPTLTLGLGTLGAVIRIREPVPSTQKLFDVGVAGPLAGFVVALGVLLYALVTLPPPTYIMDLEGHDALKAFVEQYGQFPERSSDLAPADAEVMTLVVGQTPLYWLLTQFFEHVPPMDEMYHYPILFAGWMGLFFTALNLLPVGQLDGGHILYTLVGPRWHGRIARFFVMLLLLSGALGFVEDVFPGLYEWHVVAGHLSWFILAGILYFFLYKLFDGNHSFVAPGLFILMGLTVAAQYGNDLNQRFGYYGWFVWCLLIVYLIRIDHPPVLHPQKLSTARKALAVLSMIIFILCFSFTPLRVS